MHSRAGTCTIVQHRISRALIPLKIISSMLELIGFDPLLAPRTYEGEPPSGIYSEHQEVFGIRLVHQSFASTFYKLSFLFLLTTIESKSPRSLDSCSICLIMGVRYR